MTVLLSNANVLNFTSEGRAATITSVGVGVRGRGEGAKLNSGVVCTENV